jgi:hypothetical protein
MRYIMDILAAAIFCVTGCAVGFVMAFRPKLYCKWAESSWTGQHMPRMTERYLQHELSFRILGIVFIAFALFSTILFLSLMR